MDCLYNRLSEFEIVVQMLRKVPKDKKTQLSFNVKLYWLFLFFV